MKKWMIVLLVSTLLIGIASAGTNGNTIKGDPAITVGAMWYDTPNVPPAFSWSSVPGWSNNDPFTYSSEGVTSLYVTDAYVPGDVFEVYDNEKLVGTTSAVSGASAILTDPVAAYQNPAYSHACFNIPEGRHAIDIKTIVGATGYSSGAGYLMVQDGPCPGTTPAPEFPSLALPVAMILGLVFTVYSVRTRKE
jgi:hypothetical protein